MKESYTAVLARNEDWSGEWSTEPYEAAWAAEAIFFVRVLKVEGVVREAEARVQISPDGMHWADEGASFKLSAEKAVSFVTVRHFGGWLRLNGRVTGTGALRVMAYLSLKS